MSRESNFFSRWSRLKRQSGESAAPGDADSPKTTYVGEAEASAIPELAPEELAALPRLEDLTPETDLAPFMRAGVPASLRNAALRRMWALDPTIRDRVGDALEYAYDWNIPGGVPGTGPLLASDDVQAMLRTIARAPGREGDEGVPRNTDVAPVEEAVRAEPQPGADPEATEAAKLVRATPAITPDVRPNADETATTSARSAPKEEAQVRRHGGATPF